MEIDKEGPLIFLSYTVKDRGRVDFFYDSLIAEGFNVWMDHKELLGGQNWDLAIKKAQEKAVVIIIFLSANSLDKRGYVQKELKTALDKLEEKLYDDIYVIPVLLDRVEVPAPLQKVQYIDCSDNLSVSEVVKSIRFQFHRLNVALPVSQSPNQVFPQSQIADTIKSYEVRLSHTLTLVDEEEFEGQIDDMLSLKRAGKEFLLEIRVDILDTLRTEHLLLLEASKISSDQRIRREELRRLLNSYDYKTVEINRVIALAVEKYITLISEGELIHPYGYGFSRQASCIILNLKSRKHSYAGGSKYDCVNSDKTLDYFAFYLNQMETRKVNSRVGIEYGDDKTAPKYLIDMFTPLELPNDILVEYFMPALFANYFAQKFFYKREFPDAPYFRLTAWSIGIG